MFEEIIRNEWMNEKESKQANKKTPTKQCTELILSDYIFVRVCKRERKCAHFTEKTSILDREHCAL